MRYFFSEKAVLKWLERPFVYHIRTDELYELDEASFDFLKKCVTEEGCPDTEREFIDYCLREGLLTARKTSVKHPPLIKSPVPSLRYLELQITDRCNLRCRHCYIDKRADGTHPAAGGPEGSELSTDQIRQILTEFEEMQGLRVMITGGEPLLHSNFEALNDMLPDFLIRKVLFTNGLLLNKDLLCRLNVGEIQISIDGLESGHDALRGTGTFKKAVNALRLAGERGFEVSVATMVHAKNLGEFEGMEKLFSELGIKDWTVDVPCRTGRLEHGSDFQVSPEVGGSYLRFGYGDGLHSGEKGYGCGLHLLSVMADGKVTKCTFYSDRPAGTVGEGLRRCWEKTAPVFLKDLACDCAHLEACRGGCRYRAELMGDPLGKDLYKCFFYDILENK
ncbi:MAG: radical SAM protein [Nitrospirota bacterium]|nr:radical SAM protein [Nitrospirota bacterium]